MNQIVKIDNINTAVDEWRSDFTRVIASDVDPEKFIAAVTTALTLNPDIVEKCSAESIKNSCIKAAYDGLRPDGKEGALVAYYNKDKKCSEAQWMPMVFGLRKKAKDHDGIIITARVVYAKDKFHLVLGDEEKIEHEPAPPEVDPGPVIASYAIFRRGDEILHREVMRLSDIKKVQSASKAPNSPAWTRWFDEMAKKAAVNRGTKSVPMSDAVMQVVRRDNDHYSLESLRDVTPDRPSLSSALSVAQGQPRGEGFSLGHVRSETGVVIDSRTGEIIESEVQRTAAVTGKTTSSSANAASAKPVSADAGRGGEKSDEDSRPNNSSKSSEERNNDEGGQAGPSPSLSADLIRKYLSYLARMGDAEKIDKASAQFMSEIGGPPAKGSADFKILFSIYERQKKRAAGEIDGGALMEEINAEIDAMFGATEHGGL